MGAASVGAAGTGMGGGTFSCALDTQFAAGFHPPPSYSLAGRIDQSGTLTLSDDALAQFGYAGPCSAHGPNSQAARVPRKRLPGGAQALTASATANQTSKYEPDAADTAEVGPPFRSQSERRQWLLQEKRRWLVEMRLGNAPPEPAAATVEPTKLPPISPAGTTLSSGMRVDALVTPR